MRALTALFGEVRRLAVGIEEWFLGAADDRAYAALRIGYAFAAFAVLVDFWPFRYTLLASTGLFGGASMGAPLLPLNVFTWARSEGAVTAVMLVSGAAMVCLGFGVLPRAAAAITYLWTLSYAATAPASQSGFDTILRVIGFVLVIGPSFGPWRLGRHSPRAGPPPAYGLRLVQWQLMLIYVCTVWLKAPDPFWRNGEATTYFMMSMFARFPDPSLANIGPIGALLDYGTLLVETMVPFLLWMRRTRFLGVFLGVSLHVGIGVTSKLALFTVCILPLYAAFFERHDFDRIAIWLGRIPPNSP
jgi:hypothetical protein